jgi:hypothetical protein
MYLIISKISYKNIYYNVNNIIYKLTSDKLNNDIN